MGPLRPPIACCPSIATLCHVPLSGLLLTPGFGVFPLFVIGCSQINGPPIGFCQAPKSAMVPLTAPASLIALQGPESLMCHFQVSSHCWWVPFCHRVLADYGPPIAAARPVICHGPLYRLLMLLPGP
ncbi:unnamed protein product [Staurois parvus]|uniref:Uncharacterized protein n=1 Tax=Staurois parvus TaxID=386267 RepID=A0ABN9C957_9NEOB|nr:unnamed protein product [Staurois parvus]